MSSAALTRRSLRTVRNELEFLLDSEVITPQQHSSILAQLPPENGSSSARPGSAEPPTYPSSTPASPPPPSNRLPGLGRFSNLGLGEKHESPVHTNAPPPPPPPAYGQPPAGPLPLAFAEALYAYNGTDAGDCTFAAHDRIAVLEYTNADWWKGRNERTGSEGVFPRTYVKVIEDKGEGNKESGYGNMPLDVSQSGGSDPAKPSKFNEQGKKFGKKLGNATIFGAGATIGSNIVNGIL